MKFDSTESLKTSYLKVGLDADNFDIIVNIPGSLDSQGYSLPPSHIVFTARQARAFARTLLKKADRSEAIRRERINRGVN